MEKDSPIQLASANQSVKIVPSIEESLQSMGLNISLDERSILGGSSYKPLGRPGKRVTL